MWKITTRGFTLQEVLIMAAMNFPERTDCDRQRRANDLTQCRAPRFKESRRLSWQK
jgi:hypothetical protein